MRYLLIFIQILFVFSCRESPFSKESIIDGELTFSEGNALKLGRKGRTICECSLRGDTLVVAFKYNTGYVGSSLVFKHYKNRFTSQFYTFGDVPVENNAFRTTDEYLALNASIINKGDVIVGNVKYDGSAVNEKMQVPVINVNFKGSFVCEVGNSSLKGMDM